MSIPASNLSIETKKVDEEEEMKMMNAWDDDEDGDTHVRRRMGMRMAFSCTCQENMKKHREHWTRAAMNTLPPFPPSSSLHSSGCKERRNE